MFSMLLAHPIKHGNDDIRLMSSFPLHHWSKVPFQHGVQWEVITLEPLCTLDLFFALYLGLHLAAGKMGQVRHHTCQQGNVT